MVLPTSLNEILVKKSTSSDFSDVHRAPWELKAMLIMKIILSYEEMKAENDLLLVIVQHNNRGHWVIHFFADQFHSMTPLNLLATKSFAMYSCITIIPVRKQNMNRFSPL